MTKQRRNLSRKGLNWSFIVSCVVFISVIAILTIGESFPETGMPAWHELYDIMENGGEPPSENSSISGNVRVHFLDTGQSDCILITTPDKNVLIDAADRGMGAEIVSYISGQGVRRLDLVIATHPHSDHIGSMAYVLDNMDVDELLMPELPPEITPTTRIYESLLDAAYASGCAVIAAELGAEYELSDGVRLDILSPAGIYDDLNNWSVVAKLTAGGRSFLFTGDAEKEAEADILATGADLDCDVLKSGHHGSATSSSTPFMDAASPEYAVICVGAGNDYGHPSQKVLDLYAGRGIQVFRTDLDGTIVAETDGFSIIFTTER